MSQYVLVAVPPHLATAVAELIARDGTLDGPIATPSLDASPTDLIHGWTEANLREHFRASSPKMRAFLVFLASHAGEEVTSHEAAQAVGYKDWNGISGMLGAAARRAKNHYGMKYGPWDRHWDSSDDQVRLTMPKDVAEILLAEARR
jgi:hypothetical protein